MSGEGGGARRGTSAVRRGAILLAVGAAVAAAAVPRSPVRRFVAQVLGGRHAADRPTPAGTAGGTGGSLVAAAPRGVAVVPTGGAGSNVRVAVLFRGAQPSGVIRVRAGTDPHLSVLASGDGADYTVGRDTIVIDNRGTAASRLSYDVTLPPARDVPNVVVRVSGRAVFERSGEGGTTIVTGSPPGPDGVYVIPLAGR